MAAEQRLTVKQILKWADEHHARNSVWPPNRVAGVYSAPHENWPAIDRALRRGERGLPGGSSINEVLAKHRGQRLRIRRPRLTVSQILEWADAHHKRTRKWPTKHSGAVHGEVGEIWGGIDSDLSKGNRGLSGYASLVEILVHCRGVRVNFYPPRLTVKQLLTWVDAHRKRTGRWPTHDSGRVGGVPGETWFSIENALYIGRRGFPGGSTLVQFLSKHRGRRNMHGLPPLTEKQILAWADAHLKRHKYWPATSTGPVEDAPEETWCGLDKALRMARRTLPRRRKGASLAKLLDRYRRDWGWNQLERRTMTLKNPRQP